MQTFHFRSRFVQDARLDLMGSLHPLICLSVAFVAYYSPRPHRSLEETSFSLASLKMQTTMGAMEDR